MKTKLIELMGVLAIILLFSSLAFVAGQSLQTDKNTSGITSAAKKGTYINPLPVQIPNDGLVESCADPSIIRRQTPQGNNWYMYCTTDPL